jgi:hypothetical protein
MKKALFILLVAFACSKANAQTITYTVDNYTDKLSPIKPSLTLMTLEGLIPQYGFTIEGAIGKRLGYNTVFRRDYVRNFFTSEDEIGNIDVERKSNYFEAGIDFFLTNKIKEGSSPLKIVTSSSSYGSYSYTRYFTAYVDKRTQFGLHGGVYYFNKGIYTKQTTDDNYFTFTAKNTTTLPDDRNYIVNTNNTAVFAGLIFKKVRKATVHSDGWKYYRHYGRRIYLDALIGGASLKDVVANGETYKVEAVNSSPIGYRIGFEWDQMGVVTGFEFGMRPGPQTGIIPGFNYFNLNFSFNIFNGDKRYAMRNKK